GEGRPAVRARPGQRGRALFAEPRPSRVVVLAPGTLHTALRGSGLRTSELWVETRLRLAVGQRLPQSVQRCCSRSSSASQSIPKILERPGEIFCATSAFRTGPAALAPRQGDRDHAFYVGFPTDSRRMHATRRANR